MNYKLII